MFYWSIWSLVVLLPYLLGVWHDRASLLYVAGVLFALLLVFAAGADGRPGCAKWLAGALLFVGVNGVLVTMVHPWLLAVIYGAVIAYHFRRAHGARGSGGAARRRRSRRG